VPVTAKVRIIVDQAAVREFLTSPAGPVYQFIDDKAQKVRDAAKRYAPEQSGDLRGSIDYQMFVNNLTVYAWVGSRLPYAIFVHEGTGIYGPRHSMIYPQRGRYLVFTPSSGMGSWGQAAPGADHPAGGKVFARAVRGMPGTPYLYFAMLLELPGWPVRRIPLTG